MWGYRVVAEYPHDSGAYTQGLDIHEGALYEGTGLNGESTLRLVDLATGEVLRATELDEQYFGEGIVVVDDRIYQLTWKAGEAFVYDRDSFDVIDTFTYPTEGWGLTYHDGRLIMSDGTSRITFRDPATFEEVGAIDVTYRGAPVPSLNELEYIDGEIWANVYGSDFIVKIDPASGEVTGWIDLRGLLSEEERAELGPGEVLNGIAQDPATGQIFVTGKRWPKMYEITPVPWGQG